MMLETQISTILGLTLLELVEHVAIGAIAIAVTGIVIAAASLWVSAKQTEKQSQVSSANLILELLRPWRQSAFQEFISKINNPEIFKYDEKELEKFVNQLEDIAIFWSDKTLTDNHVKEFFGNNFKMVRDDLFIRDYVQKWTDKNPKYYFVNLNKLIKRIDDWEI